MKFDHVAKRLVVPPAYLQRLLDVYGMLKSFVPGAIQIKQLMVRSQPKATISLRLPSLLVHRVTITDRHSNCCLPKAFPSWRPAAQHHCIGIMALWGI